MALVVAAIGIAIGVDQYKRVERSTAIQKAVSDITAIIGQTNAVFGKYGYRDLTAVSALNAGVLPVAFLKPQDAGQVKQAVNQFGGAVFLSPVGYNGIQAAILQYNNVPPELCTNIVTQTQHLAWGISLNNNILKYANFPLHIERIGLACSADIENRYIQWYFGGMS